MTADTFSATLGVLLMGTGNDNNTWGANANTSVFQILEDAIANALTSSVTGGTLDLSGTPPPAAASQVRYSALIFNGVLGSNQIVQVPNLTKWWWVKNATSGSFTLTMKTSAGAASSVIPQNSGWQLIYCDGANGIVVSPFNSNQVLMPDGSVTAPAYSNVNERGSGWWRAGTQDWRLSINGVDVLQATGAGASTPSVINVLSPNVLQIAGTQVIPPGTEIAYAGIALPGGGWLWEDGAAYTRATYANLFAAITISRTGDTNTSTSLTNLSSDLRGMGLDGAFVEGTGIPTGTTLTITGATTATLSQAASSSASGITLRILPWGQGDGSTTFNVPDRRYRALVGRDDMNNNNAGRSSLYAGKRLSTTGGEETHTLSVNETPVHTHTVTDPGHTHALPLVATTPSGGGGNAASTNSSHTLVSDTSTTGITLQNTGGGLAHNNMQPFGITNYLIKT